MTLIANYPSKKNLKEHIGRGLNYIETSMFGPQYKGEGTLTPSGICRVKCWTKSPSFSLVLAQPLAIAAA